jgi:hypothetical protein
MYAEEYGTELARLKFDNSMLIFNSMRKLQYHIYIPFDNSIDLSLLNEQILKQQGQYNWYDPHYDERYLAIFLPISGGELLITTKQYANLLGMNQMMKLLNY